MKKALTLLMTGVLVVALTACSVAGLASDADVVQSQTDALTVTEATDAAVAAEAGAASVPEALAENSETHDDAADYVWDSAAETAIQLNGGAITVEGEGVSVAGSIATITSAGTYRLRGSLADGQIIVDTADEETVRLILNGVDLHSATSAPLYIASADEVVIVLAEGTVNAISDAASYVQANPDEDEPNAALFSKADLTIMGEGALTVNGNYNDGLASQDGLVIAGGAITVNAVDDGVRGKDYLVVKDGSLMVTAQGDGLKADNDEEAERGYILIDSGVIQVTSGGDAITAQTDVLIAGGEFNLTSGGGSQNRIAETVSAKGLKGLVNVAIDGGAFTINAADDAIHSNGSVTINAGELTLATGDDGVHADAAVTINGGALRITESYEGIESAVITINAGDLHIVSSDDGVNVAGGNDASGAAPGWGAGGQPGRGPRQDAFAYSGSYYLYIHGGYIAVEAAGDGIDVNGAIEMTNGVVLVNGPTQQMNGALDYDAGFTLTGGFLVAAGSSGMAQAPDTASSQPSVLVYLTATQPAGTLVHVQTSAGDEVLTFSPTREFQSIAFSAPALTQGTTYEIYLGGSATGAVNDSLYQGGTYTGGTALTSFTVSGAVTTIGTGGRGPGRP